MKVVYTEEALKDLDAIADWLNAHYPAEAPAVERRIRRSSYTSRVGVASPTIGQARGRWRGAARALSIQDVLSRRRRPAGNTPDPSRRAAAVG